jgi:hypothetical protein
VRSFPFDRVGLGLCVGAPRQSVLREWLQLLCASWRMRLEVAGLGGSEGFPSYLLPLTSYLSGQAARALSTARLHVLPRFYLPPIDVVVSHGPSGVLRPGRIHLGQGFPLRCVQRFSRPGMATRRCIWQHNRYTRGQSVPVLSY